jgi:multidrug efflux pump subunit AcrB
VSWTRLALGNPVATLVAVLLVVLFGALSLVRLPVQLTPEVEKPEITIRTTWRAAAPEEVEAQIIEPQEKVLRGLPGMTQMLAKARRGQGEISIEFQVGHDLDRGLLEVLNRLNRVARYPDDADEPVISTVGGRSRAIAWFILKTTNGNTRDIQSYQDYVEEVVQTRFERVPGVARSEVRGGREREVRITFDAYRAALLGIELPEAARRAGGNEDVSGGEANVGKRLEERMVDRKSFVITRGERAMAVNAHREIGVNVLDVMNGLKRAAEELREGPLARANLSFEQVYDETVYIDRSVEMLRNNLGLGIVLAVGVLWWFLRKFRATLMVAMAIPGSVLAAFLLLDMAGRTLNVISLAGLAFAVGMTLDAAIVVLENIVRLREKGVGPDDAALQGPTEVWGALLASTATTVAIFLPIVFLEDEAGQLFADLALTIAVAVVASLIVALTVVPAAAATWLRHTEITDRHAGWWRAMTGGIMRLTDTPLRRSLWIAMLVSLPLLATWALAPKADYLPEGNRNLVFAFIIPPPGVNIDHIEKEMGDVIAARIAPYMTGEKLPRIKHYFFVAFPQGVFMGARAEREEATGELVPIIAEIIQGFPDTWAFAKRASLFGGFGEGRTIDINIQGRNHRHQYPGSQPGDRHARGPGYLRCRHAGTPRRRRAPPSGAPAGGAGATPGAQRAPHRRGRLEP